MSVSLNPGINANCYSSISSQEIADEEGLQHASKSWARRNHIFLIETALFTNVFLSGFDSTITASIYQLIGNEFEDVKIASWITTAYLVTCTSFQPLYGSFSDILGRRNCMFFANGIFALGCLGCGLSTNLVTLIFMRAITGVGGGGLITLSTIVNSDIISPDKRGIYQSFQNILVGTGAVVGASSGGAIAAKFGWKWCFLIQVPISVAGTVMTYLFVENQQTPQDQCASTNKWRQIDFSGAILLTLGLTSQLIFLTVAGSTAGEGFPFIDLKSLGFLLVSIASLVVFARVEKNTSANAIIPHHLLDGNSRSILIIGFFVGFVAYAYLFTLPLYFQVVGGDSAAQAGLRLAIPSFCTPIGGLIMGIAMKDTSRLPALLTSGISLMLLGNLCFLFINKSTPGWLNFVLLIPANIGQGITFPSTLFSFLFAFSIRKQATATAALYLFRSIGCVWGVAGTSSLVQVLVSRSLKKHLKGIISDDDISHLLSKLKQNTSLIKSLSPKVQDVVIKSYAFSIRSVFALTVVLSLIALILSILTKVKSSEQEVRSLAALERRISF
ncbi:LANO_0B08900g1_1 [Lachancea nothofagi CBS 11611]|uniref:LANO_0B08900g1_1 n=1 Tax=Lachancea nothofagi CBS 11611 TaxID=1266666 RepID=A0A1G4J1C0_9SACH|nr:LANO_0B08900g1_1 [Lachancea nothofagi CBS 11611]